MTHSQNFEATVLALLLFSMLVAALIIWRNKEKL